MTKQEALKQLTLMKEATKGASWERVLEYAIDIVERYAEDERKAGEDKE